ncbi:hypothetical protein MBOU_17880 [Mycobacterium bourgelatii]|uniref:Uncharacterized protein n=1 Tax=Mycobacterium bourgelatii TaxID=1273442 RepID=A0A7I9YM36_MYCBU|nr:hypothetical protein MBOU_17880 [Mycobacterium bourgelatii]
MDKEQAGHQVVGGQPFGYFRVVTQVQDALQPGPVEPHHLPYQLLSAFVRCRPSRGAGIHEGLDPIARCTPLCVAM